MHQMPTLEATNALCRALSDTSRVRLLHLLTTTPLTVAELVRITGLTQSRVSTHLGRLRDAGLVQARKSKSVTLYAASEEKMAEDTRLFWRSVRDRLHDPLLAVDQRRLEEALAARERGGTWADTVAGHMERHYSPGRTWQSTARAFIGLAQLGDVLDLASGDGALAELVAPRARSLTCLDVSEEVILAGARRLARFDHVRFVRGDMHALPFEDASFDQVLALNALTYATEPARVLAECARVARDGARLVAVTLAAHAHTSAVAAYDHQNLGFEPETLEALLTAADFEVEHLAVSHTERRAPHFDVITLYATRKRTRT